MSAREASSIAVFLGPSLRREAASALLEAHYLPPAQFGDVYRLIGGGVRAILLLDGVFHGRAAVWQREIASAMQSGIRVYGASSMGALRAAELRTLGMIGLGSVFEAYTSGEIDGDDEVALLHAGPEQQYRPLTQPLVNTRFQLREAATRGLVAPEQVAALIANLKALPFWERTAGALREAPAFAAMEPRQQERLRAFLAEDPIDAKRRDAVLALGEVARREQGSLASVSGLGLPAASPSYHDRFRLLRRAFPRDGRGLLEGGALADGLLANPARRRLIRWSLAARFFARQWASENVAVVTAAAAEATSDRPPPPEEWLRANALTVAEHGALLARDRPLSWLLEQPPARFDLPAILRDEALLSAVPDIDAACAEALHPVASRAAIARALPWVAAWCRSAGAAPPPEAHAGLAQRWQGALDHLETNGEHAAREPLLHAVWALEKGPVHFGYGMWSLSAELVGAMQLTGAAAAVVRRWEAFAEAPAS